MKTMIVIEWEPGDEIPKMGALVRYAAGVEPASVALAVLSTAPDQLRKHLAVKLAAAIHEVCLPAGAYLPEARRQALIDVVSQFKPDLVLCRSDYASAAYVPAVAAALACGYANGVVGARRESDGIVCQRTVLDGKIETDIRLPKDRPAIVLIRSDDADVEISEAIPPVSSSVCDVATDQIVSVCDIPVQKDAVEISSSDILVCVGRGLGGAEKLPAFDALAAKISALVCGSRPVIDNGWLPSSRQVGQSGRRVQPKVYLAFGVSGAIQHIVGMENSGTIVAVNSDPGAPIFSVAHFGAVADMHEIAKAMTDEA